MNMKISWLMKCQPDFAHCHPRSCGGKEQKANTRLSANNANKKMMKENQMRSIHEHL
jgi:hypothetical protein